MQGKWEGFQQSSPVTVHDAVVWTSLPYRGLTDSLVLEDAFCLPLRGLEKKKVAGTAFSVCEDGSLSHPQEMVMRSVLTTP